VTERPPPLIRSIDHVLMFVPSVRAAALWYSSVLQLPVSVADENFAIIPVGSAKLCFHLADSKVPAGRAGQVQAGWRYAVSRTIGDRIRPRHLPVR
jgi:catechol 2,3-dioxygenase-like lactoylglutathione lyase family enzyme